MSESTILKAWTTDWLRPRPVRIKLRSGGGYSIKPKHSHLNGRVVYVYMPRTMDDPTDGGHPLYKGETCWDIVNFAEDEPIYLSEKDFEWLPSKDCSNCDGSGREWSVQFDQEVDCITCKTHGVLVDENPDPPSMGETS